jgi:hypothetical protein
VVSAAEEGDQCRPNGIGCCLMGLAGQCLSLATRDELCDLVPSLDVTLVMGSSVVVARSC